MRGRTSRREELRSHWLVRQLRRQPGLRESQGSFDTLAPKAASLTAPALHPQGSGGSRENRDRKVGV